MNVIMVVADALRCDHLPCYGSANVKAPHLDAFSRRAVVFENCFACSFPTMPARADLFTGRFTFPYLAWGPLPTDEVTLAQVLSERGFLTCGVADTPFLLRNGYGYDRGFADFQWNRAQRSGPERQDVLQQRRSEEDCFASMTFARAMAWLERRCRERFFLYVDTRDPPEHCVQPYFPRYQGERVSPCYWSWRESGCTQRDLEVAHACYCGEISMVDRWYGLLIDRLTTLNLLDETAVLFTSDHGFYFGEHGLFGERRFRWPGGLPFEEGFSRGLALSHGLLYRSPWHREITRVPLLMVLPGVTPRGSRGLVTLPDLMPTVLDLAGAEMPDSVQARSLLPLVRGEVSAIHDVVVISAPLEELGDMTRTVDDQEREALELSPSTITDGEWDLLSAAEGESVALYHAATDGRHEHEIGDEHREVVRHGRFVDFLEQAGAPDGSIKPRRRV